MAAALYLCQFVSSEASAACGGQVLLEFNDCEALQMQRALVSVDANTAMKTSG
jgi:hypothetical protein